METTQTSKSLRQWNIHVHDMLSHLTLFNNLNYVKYKPIMVNGKNKWPEPVLILPKTWKITAHLSS